MEEIVMTVIKVPRPPESAFNKDRKVSSLLRTQLEHLQEAEFRLPARAQTNVYINAIKTEGEAADYIGRVTARLRTAHGIKPLPKTKGKGKVASIAAMADKSKRKHESIGKAMSRRAKRVTKARTGSKRKK
jgi:hypothetical protein